MELISQKMRKLAPELDPLRIGTGWKPEDLDKPQIMIESTFGDSHPGSGHLDILVNNAGVTRDGLLMKMTEEAFDQVIDTNLKGAFNTIRFTSRQMLKQKSGRIINLSSVVGVTGNAGQANYAASKAGIIGLTKAAARELASRGVTVNAIAPGFIETDMTKILPEKVKEAVFDAYEIRDGKVCFTAPACSVISFRIK